MVCETLTCDRILTGKNQYECQTTSFEDRTFQFGPKKDQLFILMFII